MTTSTKNARQASGITLEELAFAMGITARRVQQLEKRPQLSYAQQNRYYRALRLAQQRKEKTPNTSR